MANEELLQLGESYFKIRNYDKAMEYLSKAVMQGKSQAAKPLYELAQHFLKKKEYKKAEKGFQILADRGHADSCFELGKMCENGLGRRKDAEAAFGYYGEGFRLGNYQAAYRAGLLMMSDALQFEEVRDIAMSWFQEAINGGVYEAYACIGDLYSEHSGFSEETSRDDKIALSWYLRGAMQGDGRSLEEAALFFLLGDGTKQDINRAVTMLEQAFDAGRISACRQLGLLYEKGKFVHKNCKKALLWYQKGIDKGDTDCRVLKRDLCYQLGLDLDAKSTGVSEKAVAYLKEAAALGESMAYRELADLALEAGDHEQYVAYLKEGAQVGDDRCFHELYDLYKKPIMGMWNDMRSLLDQRNNSAFRKNSKKWKSYIEMFEKLEPLLIQAGREIRDVHSWNLLALLYLQGGRDFGRTDKDFLDATRHALNVEETKETLYLLWVYYCGEGKSFWKAGLSRETPKKAASLARKLANMKVDGFCGILSEYYKAGYGVKQDLKKAQQWASKETMM